MLLSTEAADVPPSACTHCGYVVDQASTVSEDGSASNPKPGDVTLCIRCGHVMVFADNLMLRDPTTAEAVEFADDHRVIAASKAIAIAHRRRT